MLASLFLHMTKRLNPLKDLHMTIRLNPLKDIPSLQTGQTFWFFRYILVFTMHLDAHYV